MSDIAANIYEYRLKCGYTQKELANMLGVSVQTISKWERGASAPDISVLPKIAEVFRISIDALFGMDAKTDAIEWTNVSYDEIAELMISRICFSIQSYNSGKTDAEKKIKLDELVRLMKENPTYDIGVARPFRKLMYISMDTGFAGIDDMENKIFNEDNDELFDFLGNATNRRILTLVYDSQRTTISENYIAETIGCEIAEVRAAIEFMEKYGMLDKSDVMVGKDKNMTLYTMSRPDGSREFILLRIIGAFGKKFHKKAEKYLALIN